MSRALRIAQILVASPFLLAGSVIAAPPQPPIIDVDGQPLAANVGRVVRAMESLGTALPAGAVAELTKAGEARNAELLQRGIDPHVLLVVAINPEERVKVARGPARGRTPAGRIHARAGQGDQRGRDDQAAADHQPAVRASSRRGGRPEHDAAGPEAPEGGRGPRRCAGTVPPGGDVHRPADDAEPQRAAGRVRAGLALQQRGGQARGDDRLRRRPGDARTSASAARCRSSSTSARPSRSGSASATTTARRPSRTSPSSTARATSIRRSPSGSPPTSSSSSRSIAPTAAVVLLPPGGSRVTYGRGPEYRLDEPGADRPRAGRGDARRPPRTLDRPDGPRLLQRRPPHPRRRLCPLHRPDAGRRARRTCSSRSRARA